ncbi:PIN domain-containing protein [Paraburkholderia humisilvae]|uniref:Ribonuclease VapC n=1 Tax=Paraburkholderia humisilvae TaxID=627669 RepID=A0A6J5F7Z7_9BURK|nr:PIN domain-containing protein [Paraburkholderia humisilvae]CAB3774939.1 tRNA(fMet)-specific endonuclease VapC [Paraburkholderia humisilvae]
MGVVIDTCIWIGLFNGQIDREALLAVTKDVPAYVSVVTIGELEYGKEACADPALRIRRARFLQSVEELPVLEITRHTASIFAMLCAADKQAGGTPRRRYHDLWIAALAIENDCAVVTANPDDFKRLPNLELREIELTPRH